MIPTSLYTPWLLMAAVLMNDKKTIRCTPCYWLSFILNPSTGPLVFVCNTIICTLPFHLPCSSCSDSQFTSLIFSPSFFFLSLSLSLSHSSSSFLLCKTSAVRAQMRDESCWGPCKSVSSLHQCKSNASKTKQCKAKVSPMNA